MRILFRLSLPVLMAFMIAPAAQVDTSRQAALDYIGRGAAAFRNGDIIAATRQWIGRARFPCIVAQVAVGMRFPRYKVCPTAGDGSPRPLALAFRRGSTFLACAPAPPATEARERKNEGLR